MGTRSASPGRNRDFPPDALRGNTRSAAAALDYNFPIMCSAFMERLPEWLTGIGTIGLSLAFRA